MKPGRFIYHAPATLEECLELLAQFQDEAALLAGGQSLIPLMRFRLAQPAHVISLRAIGGPLASIRRSNKTVVIGASVTYVAVQRSKEIASACPGLPDAIELIATPLVRTRGTVCGNLCQADPASELPAVALIMDARFRLRSRTGERVVAAKDFFVGPYLTARRGDEILTEVEFPVRSTQERVVTREVSRLAGGFPMSGVTVALTREDGLRLKSVAIGCFGVNPVQIRVHDAEAVLMADGYTIDAIERAADAVDSAIEPHSDSFASSSYRRSATRTLLKRAVDEAYHRQDSSR